LTDIMPSITSLLAAAAGFASLVAARDCKAFPGTSDWPSDEAWSSLSADVEGRLLVSPEPAAAPCHKGWESTDLTSCPKLAHDWQYWDFHIDHPTSVIWNQWSNYSCMPDSTLPCTNDYYPPFVINATDAQHVKSGVDFGE
jgi:hypothetical protein